MDSICLRLGRTCARNSVLLGLVLGASCSAELGRKGELDGRATSDAQSARDSRQTPGDLGRDGSRSADVGATEDVGPVDASAMDGPLADLRADGAPPDATGDARAGDKGVPDRGVRTDGGTRRDVRGRPVISGGTLKTDTGQIMRAGRIRASEGDARKPETWASARALGLNTMRVGFTVGAKSMTEVFAMLDPVVAAARNNRMYVMFCNAETSPGDWGKNIAENKSKSISNWRAIAPRYANETHVFYEMLNEPEEWGLWSHYATSATQPTELLIGLRAVHDVIRAAAPNTPVLVPSPANLQAAGGASQYIAAIRAFESLGPVNWTRTVWSFHYYNKSMSFGVTGAATDGGRAAFQWLKARYPIAVTETNWWMEPPRDVLINAADALEDSGVGWSIMRYPGQPGASPNPFPNDLFPDPLTKKVAQLRARGYVIPVE